MKKMVDIINNEVLDNIETFEDFTEYPQVLFYTTGSNYAYKIGEFKGHAIYVALKLLIDEKTGKNVWVYCPKTISTLNLKTINQCYRTGVLTNTSVKINEDELVVEE